MASLLARFFAPLALWASVDCACLDPGGSHDTVPLVQHAVQASESFSPSGGAAVHRGGSSFMQLVSQALPELMLEAMLDTMGEQGLLQLGKEQGLLQGEELPAARPTPERHRAHFVFRVKELGPGASSVLELEQGTRRADDGSFLGDVDLAENSSTSTGPRIALGVDPPLGENSTFVARVEIKMWIFPIAKVGVDCPICGADCAFTFFGRSHLWKMPRCPIPANWSMPIDVASWKAPGGATVSIDLTSLRARDETAFSWNLDTEF
mmetsp:Transcript_2469/g.5777  ORF Transcript_2469/g.5777 Transcript_2469/m.5777 type:complete len:265 (-) Transcript_2469:14-808(-)